MNIGIRLHDTRPGTLRQRLTYARDQGFTCAHIAMSKAVEGFSMADAPRLLTPDLAESVREDLEATQMECAVLGCYLNLADPDPERRAATQEIYRAHLRFSTLMGAEEAGAILAVEPVHSHIISTPERAQRMLEELPSDHLQIILDSVNLIGPGHDRDADQIIDDAIRRLGDRVRVLHMKDFTVKPDGGIRSQACGTGLMRYDRLLACGISHDLPMTLEDTVPSNAEAARLHLVGIAEKLKK